MGSRITTTIKMDGPFFRKDPAKTFRQNVRVMMDAVAAEGEADVKAQLAQGAGSRAPISAIGDRVADHAVGRTSAISGKRWAVTAVVSVNNAGWSRAQGISLMAAASRVEGTTHAFRRTTGRLKRARAINTDELLKDIS
jgi:hypothetical protein